MAEKLINRNKIDSAGSNEMARVLRPLDFVRHFKGNSYQIICIAIHSETREKMVVYQALYGDYDIYARPYDMFLSKVDKEKYPDVEAVYRFEIIKST